MSPDAPSGSFVKKLRPTKVRSALSRRWFERQVPRVPMRSISGLEDLGDTYGRWRLPVGLIDPSWVCYMVGAGGNIQVDVQLARRFGVTVRTIDAVDSYVQSAKREAEGVPGLTVHHAAIATTDGPIRMQVTHDSQSSSVSAAGLYDSDDFVELPGRTMASLMQELGDDHVDLFKLDIEGSEYEVLPTLDMRAMGVKVFATQLHHTASVSRAKALIAELSQQGYEPVACVSAVKITFVRTDLL